ncbi:MAG: hypothetical protein AB1715_06045 [Acidobacteriota bacterium]
MFRQKRGFVFLAGASASVLFMALLTFGFSRVSRAAKEKQDTSSSQEKEEAKGFSFAPEFFPILPWDPYHGWREPFVKSRKWGLESIADCNFNVAGFIWPEDLTICEMLGLAAIVIPDAVFLSPKDWTRMTSEEIDVKIRSVVERTVKSSAVLGYFITDEPGASDFPALAKAVAAVKKYAPGKLAYINLFPDYATTGAVGQSQLETATYSEYLERFVREVTPQLICYDNYQVPYAGDLRDPSRTASYFQNLLEIRRVSLKAGLPFWNIVSSNQLQPWAMIPSPANLSLQAYTTLAAGGRGLSWYTYYSQGYKYAPIDAGGNKTLTWHYLREVNRQVAVLGPTMMRLRSAGVYFTPPGPAAGLPVLPGEVIAEVSAEVPFMVGEFKAGPEAVYVIVVNLSLERSAKLKVKTVRAFNKMEVVSSEDGSLTPLNNEEGLWLVAGQGALFRFSDLP